MASGPGRATAGGTAVPFAEPGCPKVQLRPARRWPAEMQPDALFLAATSEDLWEICFTGAIGRAAGVGEALIRAGWTNADLEPIRRLTNPIGQIGRAHV